MFGGRGAFAGRRSAARRVALGATATAWAIVAGSLWAPAAGAAPADDYVRAPWSSDIQRIDASGGVRTLTYPEWIAAGAPTPRVASARFASLPWSTTVYGILDWQGPVDSDPDVVAALSWAEYQRAGAPRVERVAHVPKTEYFRWASGGAEIFARSPGGATHRLTYPQWTAAGSPAPATRDGGYYRAAWSDIVHRVDAKGEASRVGFASWQAAGAPTPAIAPTTYVKTPWAPAVVAVVRWPGASADLTVGLTWSEYVRAGKPKVVTSARIPGDSFVRFTIGDTVYHSVMGVLTPLTAAEWAKAGSPAPRVQEAPSPTYIRGLLVVNKSLPLPTSYGGGLTRETTAAFNAMRAEAARSGVNLFIVSGFRSFSSQRSIYGGYVSREGVARADRHSARPGFSEHQSGLAIDVNSVSQSFGSSREGRWVAANAHRFGFIVRYPQGKEHITGYMYEPWHLRFVGTEAARILVSRGLTLEEYTGVTSVYR